MTGLGFSEARFATLLDADGNPPCDPADDCEVCSLFNHRRPGESRAAWLSRITGYPERPGRTRGAS